MWTKSCGITIQMKPLQWYFYMVLLFFSISQIETENFEDKIKSCSVIIQMKPVLQYFHLVLFIFQRCTK